MRPLPSERNTWPGSSVPRQIYNSIVKWEKIRHPPLGISIFFFKGSVPLSKFIYF